MSTDLLNVWVLCHKSAVVYSGSRTTKVRIVSETVF